MVRLRMFASILSILSLIVGALTLLYQVGWAVLAAIVVAAACLAIVCPFDAPNPRERTRVVIACFAYLAALMAALVFAYAAPAPNTVMIALVALGVFGVSLTCWALATRKRRRVARSRSYYDN
ncbi:hypothetical protein [Sphingomonas sp. GB1N7]|uniref:hypothetical protein n=1 Tax=Parasphingomonas caseinilytica TaxID=3096158 RepID=UPI002FC92F18